MDTRNVVGRHVHEPTPQIHVLQATQVIARRAPNHRDGHCPHQSRSMTTTPTNARMLSEHPTDGPAKSESEVGKRKKDVDVGAGAGAAVGAGAGTGVDVDTVV